MPLLPSALPPKGEARRYVANDFLNLIALPAWERGDRAAVDRVLSFILDLRRISSLFFIPLVPYPARSARHLPHAGKALSVDIVFPHMRVFVLTMREKRYSRFAAFPIGEGVVSRKAVSSFRCLPHWGRGTAQRRSGALVYRRLETISFALFHTARTLSGSLRSPPSPRGEGFVSEIPLPSIQPPPLRGTSFHRKEGIST